MIRAKMRVVALGCTAMLLSGCLLPTYSESTQKTMTEGYTEIAQLVAMTDLGNYRSPSSFEKASPKYASAFARLNTVRNWVDSQSETAKTVGEKDIIAMLDDCRELVKLMADQHRSHGLSPGAQWEKVQTACVEPYQFITK